MENRAYYVENMCQRAVQIGHFIKRSQGGLGIPENIVTLCPECHFKEDHGQNTKLYEQKIKEYLQSIYEGWNEEDLIYKKYDNWG